jgi:hypothetical protein
VGVLDGVGQGTTLAGRYRLDERLHVAADTEMWRAVDTTLDRAVGVRVVTAHSREETVDAARRAALVEDPRLLRVLDVGSEPPQDGADDVTYVISEFVEGESMATRLARGPMRASAVRAVVGEAAEALEHARAAGLHHLRLTPASVIMTERDGIKVAGLCVDATLQDHPARPGGRADQDADPDAAARADAVALVALIYAGLTARWPGGEVDGLSAAPLVGGEPVPPADLVPGVPNDLDTLCAVTFGPHDDGPHTPGELADQLAPWRQDDETPAATASQETATETTQVMRPAGRFPVRLSDPAGSARAVGATATAAAATAAAAAGLQRPGSRDPEPVDLDWQHWGEADNAAADADEDESDGRQRSTQTRIVLAVLGLLVVVGLVLAISSLSHLGGGAEPKPHRAAQPTATPSPSATSEPSAESTEQPAAENAPAIQGVRTLDPLGDGEENDDAAPKAIDGDAETFWPSSTYKTEDFGKLKDGVGMVVDLGRASTVSGVDLAVRGSGGTVEIRKAPGPALDDSEVLTTAQIDGDPIKVTLDAPVETQYVVLWFTRLPDTGSGYRVELGEVTVR